MTADPDINMEAAREVCMRLLEVMKALSKENIDPKSGVYAFSVVTEFLVNSRPSDISEQDWDYTIRLAKARARLGRDLSRAFESTKEELR